MTTYHIHALSGDDLSQHIDALYEVLENCVSGGASVSFMHPLSREKSLRFWSNVAASTTRGERIVLVLDTATGSGAENFYLQCGWQRVGEIPRYALMPQGNVTATTFFYKFL